MNNEKTNINDEIDLFDLFRILWKRKLFILSGVFIITFLSVVIVFMLPKYYKCNGILRFSTKGKKISLIDYKDYSLIFTDRDNFYRFLSNNVKDKNKLRLIIDGMKKVNPSKAIKPIYAYTKEDIKNFGKIKDETVNFIIGVKISHRCKNPEKTGEIVKLLGSFIRESIVDKKIYDYISSNYYRSKDLIVKYNDKTFHAKFNINLLEKKKGDILMILKKYPDSRKMNSFQLVSTDNGGYRYLSPVNQIVGIESQIADLKQSLAFYKRNKDIEQIKIIFFRELKQKIIDKKTVVHVYRTFLKEFDFFLKKLDLKGDIGKKVYNDLSVAVEKFKKVYNEDIRFNPPLTISARPVKTNKKLIIFSAFFFSILFFSLLSFLLEGGKENK